MKRAACAVLACLVAATAAAQGPGFESSAARVILDVISFDPPQFALMKGREGGFAFYGTAPNELEEVRCERSASFGFIALANEAGGITVGICTREVKRVRALSLYAKGSLDGLMARLAQSGPRVDTAALEKAGWVYRQRAAAGGEAISFPVLLVGHGILGPDTVVLFAKDGKRAVVVQAESRRMCESFKQHLKTPLCSDPDGTLLQIAQRIAATVP